MIPTSRTWRTIPVLPSCSTPSQASRRLPLQKTKSVKGVFLSQTENSSLESCGLRVVAIGGGTGLSTLLRGLKHYTVLPGETPGRPPYISDLTAVVTVTDDGGSSGRLRRELNMLPPGDIRNCLVAVSEDENLLSKLFQHRFSSSGELEGHSFGNLFLAALTALTGAFAVALKQAADILATRARALRPHP